METDIPKSLYEQLKEMKPHHAIHFIHEQILQKPEDEKVLMANLTKYMFEKKPTAKEVADAFQANVYKRAEIITENAGKLQAFEPMLDKAGAEGLKMEDALEMQRVVKKTREVDRVFTLAAGVLDSYSLAQFNQMPRTIYEERLAETIDKLLG